MIELTSNEMAKAIRVQIDGRINISAALSREMGLSEGDRIQIYMARDITGYNEMYITKGEEGVVISQKKSTVTLNCKRVSDKLLQGASKGLFRVGEKVRKDDRDYYPIIYRKNYAERQEVHSI